MKVLIINDHPLFLAGLSLLVADMHPNAIVIEASNVDIALTFAKMHPDLRLCLLSLKLHTERDFIGMRQIKSSAPELAVLMIATENCLHNYANFLAADANSILSKHASKSELRYAMVNLLKQQTSCAKTRSRLATFNVPETPSMSPRQWDVFDCLMRGQSNKLICRELGLSINTVKSHLTAIFRAFDVHTRAHLLITVNKSPNLAHRLKNHIV